MRIIVSMLTTRFFRTVDFYTDTLCYAASYVTGLGIPWQIWSCKIYQVELLHYKRHEK